MQKKVATLFICFLVLAVIFSSVMVLAETERTMTKKFKTDGKEVNIKRQITTEDGTKKVDITRKITDENGETREIKIHVETKTEDGKVKRIIKVEKNGKELEVNSELNIESDFENNETDIKAVLSNGQKKKIKLMPDEIKEKIRKKLKLRLNESQNYTIQLKEEIHKNIPRVVYNVQTNENGKFLGIFKLAMKVEGEVDPETGEVLQVSKPWWAFLIKVEEAPANETGDISINEINDTDAGEENNEGTGENSLMTYAEALTIAQNSNCTAEGNLTEEHEYNEGTKTWWINMNLTMEGCSPACVVNEETQTAEVNYRCTGLVE